jgi:WD40 repeat protein
MVHQHKSVAFSVAWWRGNVCSGGFDGRVLCTSPAGDTQEVLSTSARIRWLQSSPDNGTLIIATSDGSIQEFDGGIQTLYSHDKPPYRMAFSADGRWLASGADDGSVLLYDFEHHRLHRPATAHTARVMAVTWHGHELLTSGADGALLRWAYRDNSFRPVQREVEPGSFRFLQLLRDGWTGNVDSRVLLAHRSSPGASLRLDLGRRVTQLGTSPDFRFVAATIAGEVILVDLFADQITSINIASDGTGYVGFPDSAPDGAGRVQREGETIAACRRHCRVRGWVGRETPASGTTSVLRAVRSAGARSCPNNGHVELVDPGVSIPDGKGGEKRFPRE